MAGGPGQSHGASDGDTGCERCRDHQNLHGPIGEPVGPGRYTHDEEDRSEHEGVDEVLLHQRRGSCGRAGGDGEQHRLGPGCRHPDGAQERGNGHGHEERGGELPIEPLRLQQDRGTEREPGPGRPPGGGTTSDRLCGGGQGRDEDNGQQCGSEPHTVGAESLSDVEQGDETGWPVDPLGAVQERSAVAPVSGHHREAAFVGTELPGQ